MSPVTHIAGVEVLDANDNRNAAYSKLREAQAAVDVQERIFQDKCRKLRSTLPNEDLNLLIEGRLIKVHKGYADSSGIYFPKLDSEVTDEEVPF